MWGRKKAEEPKPLILKSGHFYVDREGFVWCCYQIDLMALSGMEASCVCLTDDVVDHFYLDGRYMTKGTDRKTLVRELDFKDAWVDETYHVHTRIVG